MSIYWNGPDDDGRDEVAPVLRGPWPTLETFFCSTNGDESATRVRAKDRKAACLLAAEGLYDEAWAGVDLDDPFACDAAQEQYDTLMNRLRVYTAAEWDALCLRDFKAEQALRSSRSIQPMPGLAS